MDAPPLHVLAHHCLHTRLEIVQPVQAHHGESLEGPVHAGGAETELLAGQLAGHDSAVIRLADGDRARASEIA
jgi:hypothetical protein